MTQGTQYLIEVDLRLVGEWPYQEEELAFTFLVDGGPGITVDALDDSVVMLHRFGGTYGPARFVAVADDAATENSLWLSMLTQRGVLTRTDRLPVAIGDAGDDTKSGSFALPGFARRAFTEASRLGATNQGCLTIQLEPGGFRPDQYLTSIWSQQNGQYPVPVLFDESAEPLRLVPRKIRDALDSLAGNAPLEGLSVEFVLPNQMLQLPVDEWTVGRNALGFDYPVMVRSLERLRNRGGLEARKRWLDKWERLQRAEPGGGNSVMVRGHENLPLQTYQLQREDGPCSVFLDSPPGGGRGSQSSALVAPPRAVGEELFDEVVDAGVPVMVWPRRESLPEIQWIFDFFGHGDLRLLPKVVHQLRIQGTNARGRLPELSLMWDNPLRRPGDSPLFQHPTL
jgi:hypothetical protein